MTDLAAVARSLRYNDTWWGTRAAEDIEALLRAVPVLTWLIAEARWWAENWKADSVRERWYLSESSPFPWETPDGEQADG